MSRSNVWIPHIHTGTRRWWALGAVSLCVLAVTLDGTVLSVALPTLAGALHATESDLEWFSSGYLLLLAAAVLPAGLIGDRFGRKRVMLVSLAVFGVGSLLCALAPSAGVFLLARLLMGAAGAGITVLALSALTVLFDDDERGKAVGIYQAANFVALPLGPILGGWMLSQFWWGWVFLVNVPVVLIGLTVGLLLVPESRAARRPALDPLGMASSTVGLVAFTYGLIEAGQNGWGNPAALIAIVAGLVVLGLFAGWELHVGGRGGRPLVDPALFRHRSFAWGAMTSGLAGLGMVGLLFVMPQYFQAIQHDGALDSGLRLLPLVAGLIAGAIPAGRLVARFGTKLTVTLGFLLLAAGSGLGAFTAPGSSVAFVAIWMGILCAGTGLALAAATGAALSHLSPERSGIGSAVVQAFQKTSAPVGTAIMGSVVAAAYQAHLDVSHLPPGVAGTVRASVYGGVAVAGRLRSPSLLESVRAAFVHGIDSSLVVSVAIAGAGAVVSLLLLPGLERRRQPSVGGEPLTDER